MRTQVDTLLGYHWHTTRQLLERAAALPAEEYHAHPGYGHGSVHDIFVHMLVSNRYWRGAIETGQQPPPTDLSSIPDIAALRAELDVEEQGWRALLSAMGEGQLAGDVSLTTLRGQAWQLPLWRVLQHLLLHGMQHHSELAQLLTLKGQSPGNIDLIFYR